MTILFRHPREGIPPYPSSKLYFYNPGTTTQRNVYQDEALTSLHSQPIVAFASGSFPAIYLPSGTFKVRMETSANALIYEQDNIDPGVATGPGALPIGSGGTGATNAVTARVNLGAAAAADLTAAQDDIAVIQSQIEDSLVDGDTRLGLMAGRDTIRAVDLDDTGFGQVVTQYYLDVITGARDTTSVIPADTSIPQSGEGTEIWSRNITPKYSDSLIVVRAHFLAAGASAQFLSFALFDGGANAIAATSSATTSTHLVGVPLIYGIGSWGTGTKTLSIRFGPSTGLGRINLNSAGTPTLGGAVQSVVECFEIKGGPF